jgi:hypothetical protein
MAIQNILAAMIGFDEAIFGPLESHISCLTIAILFDSALVYLWILVN